MKNDYFDFTTSNLGYQFIDNLTLLVTGKNVLHDLYQNSKTDLDQLTAGTHPKYKRVKKEDWYKVKHNGVDVMVCTRKFVSDHGVISTVDRSSEELKIEAERVYLMLKENDKL